MLCLFELSNSLVLMLQLEFCFLQGVNSQCPAMDDDSQDELINKNASLAKGKRPNLVLLSEAGK